MRRCATRSSPSPPRSGPSSPLTSPTSTAPSSLSSTCRRRSRARFLPAIRAIPGRCGASTWRSSPPTPRTAAAPFDDEEGERAAKLYERVFLGYGDDSIAQVGGAHVACEWVSNVLTKVAAARPPRRLPRAVDPLHPLRQADRRRAAATATTATSELGPEFGAAMDELFSIYSRSLEQVESWAAERWPRGDGEPEGAWQRSIRAKALDLLRGLLPAATLSHVGIYASGQAYEQLIMRLMASPLPEAREYGGMILARAAAGDAELRLAGRAPRPRRRVDLLPGAAPRGDRALGLAPRPRPPRRRRRRALGRADPRRRDRRGAARLLPVRVGAGAGDRDPRPPRRPRPRASGPSCSAAMVGERANRRHRPGRGFEALRYRFEIVSDYGAFRDLQRHRMLTCQWQRLGPDLGAGIPGEVEEAGRRRRVRAGAGDLARRVRAARGATGLRRGRPLRALPRLPDPLHARPQRARGDAPDRAALGPRGAPDLPRRRPGDARADRRDPPGGRGGDEPRRHLPGAAPGADHERDPHPAKARAGGAGRRHRGAARASTRSARRSRLGVALLALFRAPAPRRLSGDLRQLLSSAALGCPGSLRTFQLLGGFLPRRRPGNGFAGRPGGRAAARHPTERRAGRSR